jgi:alkylated DNA repair dioxygenase AlkB
MELSPGAFHLSRYLSIERQQALVNECHALIGGTAPAYVPTVRGGGKMHVRMLCLGRHWNGQTYRYEATRSDYDGLPAPPLPDAFRDQFL